LLLSVVASFLVPINEILDPVTDRHCCENNGDPEEWVATRDGIDFLIFQSSHISSFVEVY